MAEVLAGPSGLTRQHLPVPSADDIGKYLKIDANGNPVYYTETPGGTVTEAGANAANDVGAATGATTALKLANLTANASETQEGVAELATAAEIVTGTDTGRVPNVANLKTSLASDGMWLTKRTKMPDGAAAVYSQDAWATTDGWGVTGATLSKDVVPGVLRIAASGTSGFYANKSGLTGIGGKTALILLRVFGIPRVEIDFGAVFGPVFNVGSGYTIIQVAVPAISTRIDIVSNGTVASGAYIDVDAIWIGDYSYLTGTLSEEAARIADQLGDSAGVGVAANGSITSNTTIVSAGDWIEIAGKRYTFVDAISATRVEGEVKIRTSYALAMTDLYVAINRDNPAGYDYNGTTPLYNVAEAHPLVYATNPSSAVVNIYARATGELLNSITLAKSAATLTLSGSTLSGGYSDAAAKIITAVGNNIAGSGTRPAAAKIDITSTSLIGYEQAVDVASGGTTTLPAGGTWVWFVYGHGATITSAKRGSSAGGTTLTVAGANATVWYRRYA